MKMWRTIAIALAVVLVGGGIIALTKGNGGSGGVFGGWSKPSVKIDMEKAVDVSGTSRYSNGILTLKTGTANMATVRIRADFPRFSPLDQVQNAKKGGQ